MLATECRVIRSRTANRNQLVHGSFVTLLSWLIRKSWSVIVFWLVCSLHSDGLLLLMSILSPRGVLVWDGRQRRAIMKPYYRAACRCMNKQSLVLTEKQWMQMGFAFVLGLTGYSPLASSAPLSKVPGCISSPTCSCTTCKKKDPY